MFTREPSRGFVCSASYCSILRRNAATRFLPWECQGQWWKVLEPGIFLSKRLCLHIGTAACECSYLQLGPKAVWTKAQFGQLPNYNYLLRNNDKMLSVFERKMRQDPSVYISTGLTKYMIVCTKTYIKHIHMFSTKLIAAPCVNKSDVKFISRSFSQSGRFLFLMSNVYELQCS